MRLLSLAIALLYTGAQAMRSRDRFVARLLDPQNDAIDAPEWKVRNLLNDEHK